MTRLLPLLASLLLASTAHGTEPDPLLSRTASTHPMRYYLAVPDGYRRTPGRRWPVLVCVAGAESNFRELAEDFRQARGKGLFLIVVPCTFSNTNQLVGPMLDRYRALYRDADMPVMEGRLDWDEAGLRAMLHDLVADYDSEERIYLTGFSGGGLLTYRMIIHEPARLAGAAPVCANFFGGDYARFQGRFPPEVLTVPIHVLFGEHDPGRPPRRIPLLGSPVHEFAVCACLGIALGFLTWQRTRRPRWVLLATGAAALAFVGLRLGETRLPGLDDQQEAAVRLLSELGYRKVWPRVMWNLGHEPAPGRVIEVLRPGEPTRR